MPTPINLASITRAIAAHLALPITDTLVEPDGRWRVSLYQTDKHKHNERATWQFTLGVHPQFGELSVLRYGPGNDLSDTRSTYLPLDVDASTADIWRSIKRHATGGDWCAGPDCQADLAAPDSVSREYVNKDDGDPCYASGRYHDGEFVSDAFNGFSAGRFDLLDDSDTCASCGQHV
jgi:hypothetical protein